MIMPSTNRCGLLQNHLPFLNGFEFYKLKITGLIYVQHKAQFVLTKCNDAIPVVENKNKLFGFQSLP